MTTHLLSYPRSGNTFVRYIIETLTDYPTGFISGAGINAPILNSNSKKELIIKTHYQYPEEIESVDNNLILILRNPIECIIRNHHTFNYESIIDKLNGCRSDSVIDYISILKLYESFPQRKIMLRYENLISNNLKDDILNLINFIDNANLDKVDEFINNIEDHRKKSLKIYKNSETKGKSLKYHSNFLNEKTINQIQEYIESNFPRLYNKFLKQYER